MYSPHLIHVAVLASSPKSSSTTSSPFGPALGASGELLRNLQAPRALSCVSLHSALLSLLYTSTHRSAKVSQCPSPAAWTRCCCAGPPPTAPSTDASSSGARPGGILTPTCLCDAHVEFPCVIRLHSHHLVPAAHLDKVPHSVAHLVFGLNVSKEGHEGSTKGVSGLSGIEEVGVAAAVRHSHTEVHLATSNSCTHGQARMAHGQVVFREGRAELHSAIFLAPPSISADSHAPAVDCWRCHHTPRPPYNGRTWQGWLQGTT